MKNIIFLVPFFNEEKNLKTLSDLIKKTSINRNFTYKILFLDDCSTDNSFQIISEFKSKNMNDDLIIYQNTQNLGHGKSLLRLYDLTKDYIDKADSIVTFDSDMKIEELLELMTEENYIKLVRYIGTEFQNEEVDAWREEFDGWREEDQLPDGKVFLTLNRMNGFLGDDRYNLAVLIGNTPELEEVEGDIQNAYSRAWNEVVQNQYYTAYYKAFEEFLGKPIGEGTTSAYKNVVNHETGKDEYKKVDVPVKYFDVTDRARAMIVRHAYEIDNPEDFLYMIDEFDLNYLCPSVDDYPWDDDEVNDLFQDFLWDYL